MMWVLMLCLLVLLVVKKSGEGLIYMLGVVLASLTGLAIFGA